MPTWAWWFIPVFVAFTILAFIMSPPEAVATRFVQRYQLHPEIQDDDTQVSIDGDPVTGHEKARIIESFNKAVFIERYYQVLPKHSGLPIVLDTRQGTNAIRLFIYTYPDHVDVFKQRKRKVVAYRLLSEELARMGQSAAEVSERV